MLHDRAWGVGRRVGGPSTYAPRPTPCLARTPRSGAPAHSAPRALRALAPAPPAYFRARRAAGFGGPGGDLRRGGAGWGPLGKPGGAGPGPAARGGEPTTGARRPLAASTPRPPPASRAIWREM